METKLELRFFALKLCLQLSSQVFLDLVDSVIADVASECHRVARLGLDRDLEVVEEELRLSVEARAKVADPSNNLETNTKYVVDLFGQTHPPVASEVLNCMNCGRQIVAGRFAPHLEKCMGKVISSTAYASLLPWSDTIPKGVFFYLSLSGPHFCFFFGNHLTGKKGSCQDDQEHNGCPEPKLTPQPKSAVWVAWCCR